MLFDGKKMNKKQHDSDFTEQQEAQRILQQVERDSQSIILGGLPSHAAQRSDDGVKNDALELWGRRIGRSLAVAFAVLIVIWFLMPSGG